MFSANATQVSSDKLYVDDVFSTYLYTGNGSTQTINNGIDLAGNGGLVWIKWRNGTYYTSVNHILTDTERGVNKVLSSDLAGAQYTATPSTVNSFNSNGFSIDTAGTVNWSGESYVSWTFRKAPKFFDVVTYTGDGANGRQVSHSLNTAVGAVIIKRTDSTGEWAGAFRKSDGSYDYWISGAGSAYALFSTAGSLGNDSSGTSYTSTYFKVGSSFTGDSNLNGTTYVAYLFAHDPSADGIIQCGSYVGTGSDVTVNLGWEPQYLLVKRSSGSGNPWNILDSMRGWTASGVGSNLHANDSLAESIQSPAIAPTSTGFVTKSTDSDWAGIGSTYTYLAIRRPNKPPTTGTQVYNASAMGYFDTAQGLFIGDGSMKEADLVISRRRGSNGSQWQSRLIGATKYLRSESTAAESTDTNSITEFSSSFQYGNCRFGSESWEQILSGAGNLHYFFRRAPGFFDVVCYTGTGGSNTRIAHNLGVAPELIIVKDRNPGPDPRGWWNTYTTSLGINSAVWINQTNGASAATGLWGTSAPTATTFGVGNTAANYQTDSLGQPYVAYLFASLPGISKIDTYTGNGSSQTINCGFSAGARFILIRRTDSTGDWYVWSSATGIVAANDPHLSLNTTAAEVTTDDSVDPDNSGFIVNQNTATNINVNAASYNFLTIA